MKLDCKMLKQHREADADFIVSCGHAIFERAGNDDQSFPTKALTAQAKRHRDLV